MITLSLLGQLDLIAAATGNAPVAASDIPDPFVFRRHMRALAGKPAVIRVRRHKSGEEVNLFVPPAFH